MDNAAIISQLKSERDGLVTQVRGAEARITQLDTAIAALEGRSVASAPTREGRPTVTDMVEGVLREQFVGRVFDQGATRTAAMAKFPAHSFVIKTGIYNAFTTLTKRKKIERCPGGFRLTP